jgi:hypothetical protein
MRIGVSLTRVGVNMGDHAQDIITDHEVGEGETVESLVERLLYDDSWTYDTPAKIAATRKPKHEWYLTVRVTEPAP